MGSAESGVAGSLRRGRFGDVITVWALNDNRTQLLRHYSLTLAMKRLGPTGQNVHYLIASMITLEIKISRYTGQKWNWPHVVFLMGRELSDSSSDSEAGWACRFSAGSSYFVLFCFFGDDFRLVPFCLAECFIAWKGFCKTRTARSWRHCARMESSCDVFSSKPSRTRQTLLNANALVQYRRQESRTRTSLGGETRRSHKVEK